jgi:uncharacterized protein YjdB
MVRLTARAALAALAAAASLAACSSSSHPSAATQLTVTAVTVSPASSALALGTSQAFTARARYSDGSEQDVTATAAWASSSAGVVRLGAAAVGGVTATAVALGAAQITATLDGTSGSAAVTVTEAVLQTIAVTPGDATLPLGVGAALAATGRFSDGQVRDLTADVTWTSSDPAVASVSTAGLVEPQTVGSATVTAALGDVSGTAAIQVTAATLDAIDVFPGAVTLAKGTTAGFTAVGTFSDGSSADVTASASWSADSGAVLLSPATPEGVLVTAAEVGSATVSAALAGVTGAAAVSVTAAELASLVVTPASLALPAGLSSQLVATGTFSDGSTQDITAQVGWAVSDAAVAVMSDALGAEGLVTALGAGSATVTATLFGASATAELTVTTAALQAITVTPAIARVPAGYQLRFTATGTYTDGDVHDVTQSAAWTSSDPAVATVVATGTSAGTATGVAVGTATITAGLQGLSGAATLTVANARLLSVAVTPAPFTVSVGGTQALVATGTFSDGNTADITRQCVWSSSSKALAVVSRGGVVKGLQAGGVTITAKRSGKLGRASGTVE